MVKPLIEKMGINLIIKSLILSGRIERVIPSIAQEF